MSHGYYITMAILSVILLQPRLVYGEEGPETPKKEIKQSEKEPETGDKNKEKKGDQNSTSKDETANEENSNIIKQKDPKGSDQGQKLDQKGSIEKDEKKSGIQKYWTLTKDFFDGGSFVFGYAQKETYFEYGTDVSDNKLTEGKYNTYLLSIRTFPTMSKSGRWGYYYETGFDKFHASEQSLGDDEITHDVGTSVKGSFAYFTPVGLINFGSPPGTNANKLGFSITVGAGVGYMRAQGDILVNEGSGVYNRKNVDHSGLGLSVHVTYDLRYGPWEFRTKLNRVTESFRDREEKAEMNFTEMAVGIFYSYKL